ncbi:hypothetical protein D0Z07_2195 [Hyphodiscus hymeniophilus]|uniref:Uncharacterized protein n=1 Tax=Hyphodiscus hymeniophilus TaxID=353542 RepID=A0A9P7AYL8_9HELO|nr:hypothetical protein D0Z07_2195 [Hyphodiscus hymeniophilus]
MDETIEPLQLLPMPHLVEARCAGDDWAGISSWTVRKQRQNRLNQRAYKQLSTTLAVMVASKTIKFDPYEHYTLPADHLLTLVRYNLYRAVAANSWSLGIDPRLMHSDIPSPFESNDSTISRLCLSLPPSLHPTVLQRTVPHHPYIDLFPFPAMRDFLIHMGDDIDDDSLCADVAGDAPDSGSSEHTGIIVWGEPWDPFGWEVTESLWIKRSNFFKGVPGILHATNHWRQLRGEPPLAEIT